MDANVAARLSKIYKRIEDIDLYLGAISEYKYADAAVGPTAGCIIGQQYNHLKFGDRYFYEHGSQSGSFNSAQLSNIRAEATLSRILCRTGGNISHMQRLAFYYPSNYNPLKPCSSLPDIDYRLWRNTPRY